MFTFIHVLVTRFCNWGRSFILFFVCFFPFDFWGCITFPEFMHSFFQIFIIFVIAFFLTAIKLYKMYVYTHTHIYNVQCPFTWWWISRWFQFFAMLNKTLTSMGASVYCNTKEGSWTVNLSLLWKGSLSSQHLCLSLPCFNLVSLAITLMILM